jgi:hypothetical protein
MTWPFWYLSSVPPYKYRGESQRQDHPFPHTLRFIIHWRPYSSTQQQRRHKRRQLNQQWEQSQTLALPAGTCRGEGSILLFNVMAPFCRDVQICLQHRVGRVPCTDDCLKHGHSAASTTWPAVICFILVNHKWEREETTSRANENRRQKTVISFHLFIRTGQRRMREESLATLQWLRSNQSSAFASQLIFL